MNVTFSTSKKTLSTSLGILLWLSSLFLLLPNCSSKKTVKVQKLEHNLGGAFTIDTINIIASNEDVAWRLTTDNFWILLDSQIQFGSKQYLFNVLDNPDTVAREAKIFVTGQDLDSIIITVKQAKGTLGGPGAESSESSGKEETTKRTKKIIIEEQPVEDISSSNEEGSSVPNETAATNTKKKPSAEVSKLKMDISVDESVLGAATNLESSPVNIDASDAWKINLNTVPQWLSIISVADNKAISHGTGNMSFKFKSKEANTTTAAREGVVEFQSGKMIKTIKIIQKPTEADLTLSTAVVKLLGEPDENGQEITVKATNTQWTIVGAVPDWLKINKTQGTAGQSVLNIKANNNETPNVREVKLQVVSTGEVIKKELIITQDMQSVKIQVSPLADMLGSKAESFSTFTVNSTAEWSIVKNEEVTWYDLDVTNGTGGEDNTETVTVTAVEANPDIERVDTLIVVSKTIKRKVVIIQRGAKLKPVTISVTGVDTIDFDADITESKAVEFLINSNDKWSIKNLPIWLSSTSMANKTPISNGYGDDKIELKLNQPKDSIKAAKLQFFTIQSDIDPNVKKTIYIKAKSAIVKKEINVTGLVAGNYIPYLEIGNVTKSASKTNVIASNGSLTLYSSVEFSIKEDINKTSTQEKFFSIKVDNEAYELGDVISSGNHTIIYTALGDNILDPAKSKIKILYFMVNEEMMPYKDNTNNKAEILQFEIKQESLVLDESKPKIYVENISFNGYNSYVVLGNPNPKKADNDTAKHEVSKKVVKIKTNKSIKISVVEDVTPFFNLFYGVSPEKTNNSYKIGKAIPPGEYYFSFESKKNYTDPNGFKSRQTLTLFFENVDADKTKKTEEAAEDVQPNLMFIDTKNRDYTGLHFRTEFLVEQESL